MSVILESLFYTEGHTWLRLEDDQGLCLGITEHGQALLGDVVYVQLPEVGAVIEEGQVLATLESVKSAWDVLAPIRLEVIEVNETLRASPERVNEDPYAEGWLIRCRCLSPLPTLMDALAYKEFIGE